MDTRNVTVITPNVTVITPNVPIGVKLVFETSEYITLYFERWTTTTFSEYLGACIGIALLAFVYEGLKVCKHLVGQKQKKCHKSSIIILTMHKVKYRHSTFRIKKIALHFLQTFIHAIQVFMAFMLMLAFMSLNTYICISIMVGYTLGHLMFGWIPIVFAERCNY